ncbi:two-component system chemotaxis sensor kinase CheA [Marinimicrobium koreense]|uniref:Chemotaxis protein CheA n=1 Tax=Marinimicrobium koreense TaxID=306545 RepID=A0A3N1NUU0_9GAMM|nr:chemotaxis protein CheA [Marinimicrobium koreense]ROQ19965.1 two-component system chemotaxis sensor kinase CheA [Marinimicrobium koreense]
MGFGDDEEILQDFLVEAGEILEKLSEQLVELEQRPDDADLLNAIFRGFHTVKGGAGFLQLDPMVECCHVTENLFDVLRNGQRQVTSELMDVVLQSLDTINQQFAEVSQREDMSSADPQLIDTLQRLVNGEPIDGGADTTSESDQSHGSGEPVGNDTPKAQGDITDDEFEQLLDAIADEPGAAPAKSGSDSKPSPEQGDVIQEDEFEALLDELHGKGKGPGASQPAKPSSEAPASESDEIDDDEFEALLDQLHGKGKGPGTGTPAKSAAPEPSAPAQAPAESGKSASGNSSNNDLISDDEFESLLDELHGKGQGPTRKQPDASGKPDTSAAAKPDSAPSAPKAASPAPAAPAGGGAGDGKKPPASRPAGKPADRDGGPAPAETTVRVDTQRLDEIMNMVGELVLVRNRLVRLGDDIENESLAKAVSNLDVVTADLQTSVMKTRMQPIKKVFGRFPRVVRDLARNLKKEVNLELVGEDTDLDKNLVEALSDPLVHLVRNSVDHGIELPDLREANGKPRTGKVVLAAEQEGDHILLSITDDGAGMDPDKLRDIAVEKGVMDRDSANRLSDTEAFNLIFAPGFSTKKEISDVSGRGVGMDVVKTKITQLNGTIEIQSTKGEGTRLNIKVPLTLAIMPTLMVMLAEQAFALPLASVQEIFHMDMSKTHTVDGQECVTIRDRAIPVFYLKDWLITGPRKAREREAHVVIVAIGTRMVGFVVDQLIGQEEVVIKPLGKMLQGTPGMAGATITGDGTMALILDIPGLLKRYAGGV